MEIKSKEEVLEILKKGGYPVPSFLLGQAPDPDAAPRMRSAGCEVQIRRVLGANEEATLDKKIMKAKANGAPLEAELERRRKA
jgi:hypothetical protein